MAVYGERFGTVVRRRKSMKNDYGGIRIEYTTSWLNVDSISHNIYVYFYEFFDK